MTVLHPDIPLTLAALAHLPRWVPWQTMHRDGPDSPVTKVPFNPHSNGKARADDPATWGTRDAAEAHAARLPKPFGMGGVGIEFGDLADNRCIGGVDLDTCREADGTLAPWATDVVERLGNYTECSPSGTGVKVFFEYSPTVLPMLRSAMGTAHGKQFKRGGGEHPPAIELHISNRYFAVTDKHLPGTPPELRPVPLGTLLWLVREAGPAFAGDCPAQTKGNGHDGSRSAIAFRKGIALRRGSSSFNGMCDALAVDPETAEWVAEKGYADDARELHRIWDAGAEPAQTAQPQWPILDTSIATADTLPAPDLPLHDVFPALWAEWIARAAEAKGAPAGYVATALLAVSGSLIGNARWAQPWEEWAEPPAINVAVIGLPSAGKSPSLDALADPITKIEADDNEDWQERRRDHARDDLAAKLKRESWQTDVKEALAKGNPPPAMPADAAEPMPPQRRRIMSTDPTVAKAERMSAANPRGLILFRDELAGWVAGLDRYSGGGDRQFWLQVNGGRPWTPDRVKDGDNEIAVPHLTWGIVGGIQPDRLASLLLAGDDDGMAARFIYCWPDAVPPRRPPAGQRLGEVREWLKRLRTLPWTPPAPLLVPFSAAAQAIMQEWREAAAAMEVGAGGLFLSWLGKLPGFAAKLALIFAYLAWCADGRGEPPGEVTEADILRAVTFLSDYAVPMARRAFGEAALPQAERDSRRLARWLLRQKPPPGTLNARKLRRMADGPGIPTAARVDAALHDLAELGLVREAASNRTGGRPRSDWIVHPDIVAADGMA
jgi:Protein of unknown function (DUF3987)